MNGTGSAVMFSDSLTKGQKLSEPCAGQLTRCQSIPEEITVTNSRNDEHPPSTTYEYEQYENNGHCVIDTSLMDVNGTKIGLNVPVSTQLLTAQPHNKDAATDDLTDANIDASCMDSSGCTDKSECETSRSIIRSHEMLGLSNVPSQTNQSDAVDRSSAIQFLADGSDSMEILDQTIDTVNVPQNKSAV